MKNRVWWIGLVLVAAACGARDRLDTRTFQLQYLQGDVAARLLSPYVFADRKDAPGKISWVDNTITIRETADNLEKISRVLTDFDKPQPSVRLHFQLIQADGAATSDPAIADVEAALRKLFRFKGYKLLAEAVLSGEQGTPVSQFLNPGGDPYQIRVDIQNIRVSGDSSTVRIATELRLVPSVQLLETVVTLRSNQTAVLGNTSARDAGTIILTVRPEVMHN